MAKKTSLRSKIEWRQTSNQKYPHIYKGYIGQRRVAEISSHLTDTRSLWMSKKRTRSPNTMNCFFEGVTLGRVQKIAEEMYKLL